MLCEWVEIAVGVEELQILGNAEGGNQGVDGLADGEAPFSQGAVVLRALQGHLDAHHLHQGELQQGLARRLEILWLTEPLKHFGKDQVANHNFAPPERSVEVVRLGRALPVEIIDPYGGVTQQRLSASPPPNGAPPPPASATARAPSRASCPCWTRSAARRPPTSRRVPPWSPHTPSAGPTDHPRPGCPRSRRRRRRAGSGPRFPPCRPRRGWRCWWPCRTGP